MPTTSDRFRISNTIAAHVRAAAAGDEPIVARDYRLGSSGVVVDLAVAADELIGFVVRGADDGLAGLTAQLAKCAHYLDRVVLVLDGGCHEAAERLDLAGAALWTVDASGTLREWRPGRVNAVGPAALLDLMTADDRAALLRPFVAAGPRHDRDALGPSAARMRAQVGGAMAAPATRYWTAFGAR